MSDELARLMDFYAGGWRAWAVEQGYATPEEAAEKDAEIGRLREALEHIYSFSRAALAGPDPGGAE